jgi:hypothetical protein
MKFLAKVSPAELTKFRASWSNGETTTHRKHEMLASFFRFCQRNELIGKKSDGRPEETQDPGRGSDRLFSARRDR